LELDVDAKKQQIERYSLQQFQTKKNEEYRALTHEIDMCKEAIVKLEDEQLELMEQSDAAQKVAANASQAAADARKAIDSRLGDLASREENLRKELSALESNRTELAEAVEPGVRSKYDRLFNQRGGSVVVGSRTGFVAVSHATEPRDGGRVSGGTSDRDLHELRADSLLYARHEPRGRGITWFFFVVLIII